MNKKRIKTTHFEIFNYWKDYGINEKGEIEKFGDTNLIKLNPIVNDWGEPECWCCGKHHLDYLHQEQKSRTKPMTLKQIWNHKSIKSLLQKCHIVPRSLGGNDEASNLFLLCDRCHRLYPNTISSKHFFFWHKVMIDNFIKYRDQFLTEFLKISLNDMAVFNNDMIRASKGQETNQRKN